MLVAFSVLYVGPARADLTLTLSGVTFADGGTASGYFVLDADGYITDADITTTPGTSVGNEPIAGFTYTLAGSEVANTPVFDTLFYFNSTEDAFSLALDVENALTPGSSGYDPLVLGSSDSTPYTGSIETCQEGGTACGGPTYQDGRLVIAGALYAPEPATLSLLAVGSVALPLLRRRRRKAARGAA